MEKIKELFARHQKTLCWFANTSLGRKYLGIRQKGYIFSVRYNGYDLRLCNEKVCCSIVFTDNFFYKKLIFAITCLEILDLLKIKYQPFAILHYLHLAKLDLPSIYLDTENLTSTGRAGTCRTDYTSGYNWSTVRNASSSVYVSSSYLTFSHDVSRDNSGNCSIYRIFHPFNTSFIGSDGSVSEAKLYFKVVSKDDSTDKHNIHLIPTTQAPTGTLTTDDYDQRTYSNKATPLSITSMSVGSTYYFTLTSPNTDISKTGYTMLGQVHQHDYENSEPTCSNCSSRLTFTDTYLQITYTPGFRPSQAVWFPNIGVL